MHLRAPPPSNKEKTIEASFLVNRVSEVRLVFSIHAVIEAPRSLPSYSRHQGHFSCPPSQGRVTGIFIFKFKRREKEELLQDKGLLLFGDDPQKPPVPSLSQVPSRSHERLVNLQPTRHLFTQLKFH